MRNYSVIIRTLGTAGEKYKALLNSIVNQTLQAKEIIVVLPYGYTLDYSLGLEKIIFTEKGMVNQRVVGINNAVNDFVLVVDDDVSFETNFVNLLFKFLEINNADVVLPTGGNIQAKIEISNSTNEKKFKNTKLDLKKILIQFKHIFIGQRFYHSHNSKYNIKISPTGGHSIIKHDKLDLEKCYLSQSGNFQCFFMKTKLAKEVHFEEDLWLDETKYAIYDDQVFFYKAFLNGCKIVTALKIKYLHLDARNGHVKSDDFERLKLKLFGNMRNRTIFWKLYLFDRSKFFGKIWLIVCYLFGLFNTFFFYLLGCIFSWKKISIPFGVFQASFVAFKYCKNKNSVKC